MTSDMNNFVKFKNHDGGIVRVGNNATCQQGQDKLHLMVKLTSMMLILLMD